MSAGPLIGFFLLFSSSLFAFEDINQVKAGANHCANAKRYAYEAELAGAELKKLKIEKEAVAGAEAGLSAGLKGSLSGWAKAFEAWEKIPTPAEAQGSGTCQKMTASHQSLNRCLRQGTQDWKTMHSRMKGWADQQSKCVNSKEECSIQAVPQFKRHYWEVESEDLISNCVRQSFQAKGNYEIAKYVKDDPSSKYKIYGCKEQDFTPSDAQFPKVAGERLSRLRKRLKQMDRQISRRESDFKQYSAKAKTEKEMADKIAAAQKVPKICDAQVKDYSQEAAKLKADTEALLKKAKELLAGAQK